MSRGGVSPTLGEGAEGGTERAERSGGLHKRSAEDWGNPLTRAIGAEPLSEVCLPYMRASARKIYWGGRCGKERPAEEGGGERFAVPAREDASSLTWDSTRFGQTTWPDCGYPSREPASFTVTRAGYRK